MYEYRVFDIPRVIDGDTFDFDVDLGFYTIIRVRVRLNGIDTPEVYGPNRDPERGPAASEAAAQWLARVHEKRQVGLRTFKANWDVPLAAGAFGRWLGDVYDIKTGEYLAQYLIGEGHEK